jgi:hypothetical protein
MARSTRGGAGHRGDGGVSSGVGALNGQIWILSLRRLARRRVRAAAPAWRPPRPPSPNVADA